MRKIIRSGSLEIEILRWYEKPTAASFLEFHDEFFALTWLRQFVHDPLDMLTLRHALVEEFSYTNSSGLDDHDILQQLARQIARGDLKLVSKVDERRHIVFGGASAQAAAEFTDMTKEEAPALRAASTTADSQSPASVLRTASATADSPHAATSLPVQPEPEPAATPNLLDGSVGVGISERTPGKGWVYDKAWQKDDSGKWVQSDDRGLRKDRGRKVQTDVSVGASHDWKQGEFFVDPNLQYKDEHTEIKMLSGSYHVSSGIEYDVKSGYFSADLIQGGIHGAVLDERLRCNLFGSERVNGQLAAEVLSAGANAGIGVSVNKKEREAVAYAEVGAEANIAKVEGEVTFAIPLPFTAREFIIGLGGEASIGAKAVAGLRAGYDKKHGAHISLGAKAALGVGLGANVILGIK